MKFHQQAADQLGDENLGGKCVEGMRKLLGVSGT